MLQLVQSSLPNHITSGNATKQCSGVAIVLVRDGGMTAALQLRIRCQWYFVERYMYLECSKFSTSQKAHVYESFAISLNHECFPCDNIDNIIILCNIKQLNGSVNARNFINRKLKSWYRAINLWLNAPYSAPVAVLFPPAGYRAISEHLPCRLAVIT